MTRLTFVLFTILILTSCTNSDQSASDIYQKKGTVISDSTIIGITSIIIDTTLKLGFFKSVPDTIDGCGEYFTYDTNNVSKNKYIFLSNLISFAIIKIDGINFYLSKDTIESKEINAKSYVAVYSGHGYKAILTVKQTTTYDEGGFYIGTLQIIGDKKKATFKVHGEAGC
jgi:hypothetical protein